MSWFDVSSGPAALLGRARWNAAAGPAVRRHAGRSRSGRLRLAAGLLSALYMALVWWSYSTLVAPPFTYLGYSAEPVQLAVAFFCALLGLLPVLWMPLDLDRPTKFVYWLLYLYVINPAATIAPAVLRDTGYAWVVSYAVIVFGFWLIQLAYRVDLGSVPKLGLRLSPQVFWAGVIALSLLNYGAVFLQFGFRLRLDLLTNLLGSELSSTRLEARRAFESSGFPLSGYCLTWQSGAVNPLLIAYGTVRRSRLHLAAGLFGQLVLFSVAASKSMLISSLIVWLAIFLLHERRRVRAARNLVLTMVTVVAVGAIHQTVTRSVDINSILARRAIMTPPVLTRYYVDFFSAHPKTYLSQGLLSGYVRYPYVLSVPRTVGQTYIGDATSANANLFADAFANFGLVGIIGFSLLLAAVFLFIDANCRRVEPRLTTAVLVVSGMTLVNSALLTSLLTHGIILATLLLAALDGLEAGAPGPAPVRGVRWLEAGPEQPPWLALSPERLLAESSTTRGRAR